MILLIHVHIINSEIILFHFALVRGQNINANFFCTMFFDNPSGHGRPRRKSWTSAPKSAFSCGPDGGEKLFDPWASGRKGQECPRENPDQKVYVYAVSLGDNFCRTSGAAPTPFRNLFRKSLVSVKFSARNSGTGNGCTNFMDAWKNASVLQEKPCP